MIKTDFKNTMIRIVSVFLLVLISTTTAQDVIISGKVRHANTYVGIAGVNIFISGTNYGTTSQSDGQFILKIGHEIKNNDIIFEHVAFDTLRLTQAESADNDNFYLQPRIIQLGNITVVAERIPPEILKDIPNMRFRDISMPEIC
jgi:hypothetical protein